MAASAMVDVEEMPVVSIRFLFGTLQDYILPQWFYDKYRAEFDKETVELISKNQPLPTTLKLFDEQISAIIKKHIGDAEEEETFDAIRVVCRQFWHSVGLCSRGAGSAKFEELEGTLRALAIRNEWTKYTVNMGDLIQSFIYNNRKQTKKLGKELVKYAGQQVADQIAKEMLSITKDILKNQPFRV